MSIKLELPTITDMRPRLTVIGVGGAGCNAINNMIAAGLTGVEFVVANTDAQALAASSAEFRIQLGMNLTEGLGAGSKPEIGEAAAEEAIDEIRTTVSGSHMVFVAAGMGGGTGTGAVSVIARVAKELGILTVGVVTKPFQFEGSRRLRIAEAGISELRNYVDTLIVIPNQNLFRIANEKTTFAEAFVLADQVLYSGVACIVDLIIKEGLINLDFADVRTVMSGMGTAMMGTGEASGERRAIVAAEEAIANPLLDDVSLRGARGLLLSITGGRDLTLYEVDEAATRVREEVDQDANIIVGATFDDSLGDRVRVSIVASGMTRSAASATGSPAGGGGVPRSEFGSHQGATRQPASSLAAASNEDLQRRLSEAMQYGSAPAYDPSTYGGGIESPKRNASPGGSGKSTWQAPGDVTIEEGFSGPMPGASPAVPRGFETHEDTGVAFSPKPPADMRRSQRRMPEVEDFPAVAQREYRAKSAEHPSSGPPAASGRTTSPEVKRRPGLFARLTGKAKYESDSQETPVATEPHSQVPRGHAPAAARPREAHQETIERPRAQASRNDEAADLPSVFTRDRR